MGLLSRTYRPFPVPLLSTKAVAASLVARVTFSPRLSGPMILSTFPTTPVAVVDVAVVVVVVDVVNIIVASLVARVTFSPCLSGPIILRLPPLLLSSSLRKVFALPVIAFVFQTEQHKQQGQWPQQWDH